MAQIGRLLPEAELEPEVEVLLCDIYYTQLYSNNLLPILDAPTARI